MKQNSQEMPATAQMGGHMARATSARPEATADAEVGRRIFKFLRLMSAGKDDASLLGIAVARNWMHADGSPTSDGRRLVQGFGDLDPNCTAL